MTSATEETQSTAPPQRDEAALAAEPVVPRDEWERQLVSIGVPCGVSLSDEACSRESLYD